jgi:hypothetical protein
MGMVMRMMLRAQSDLRMALPVVNTSIVLDAVKRPAEGLPLEDAPPAAVGRSAPVVPLLRDGDLPRDTLAALSGSGTVLLVHPRQWIQTPHGPLDLMFTTGAVKVKTPVEKARHYTMQFERYGEFFDQVRRVRTSDTDAGKEVNWRLGLGFGFLSVRINYTLGYTYTDEPLVLPFHIERGDIGYIYGAWEWVSLNENETLAVYTTVSEPGPDAPAVLRLADTLPNQRITVGVSTAGIILENIQPWLEAQPDLAAAE